MHSDFDFEEPWEEAVGSQFLLERLLAELTEPHPLHGQVRETVALRVDTDDVLVRTEGGYALVHLSWCRRSQPSGDFPHYVAFDSWQDFLLTVYLPDIGEWREHHPPDVWSQMISEARAESP